MFLYDYNIMIFPNEFENNSNRDILLRNIFTFMFHYKIIFMKIE